MQAATATLSKSGPAAGDLEFYTKAAEASDWARRLGLPPLRGTFRQVAWGEIIRRRKLLENVDRWELGVSRAGTSPDSQAYFETTHAMVARVEDAAWWINVRGERSDVLHQYLSGIGEPSILEAMLGRAPWG